MPLGFLVDTSFPSLVRRYEILPESRGSFRATARQGTQVVIPYREEDETRHLKPMGDLGQIVRMVRRLYHCFLGCMLIACQEWDIRNEAQIAECLRHSDIVYNLVGREYETK